MNTADDYLEPRVSLADSFRPWIVCLSAALFFFYEFIQMHMFNSISPGLMRDFSVDAVSLGYLSSTYLYADVIFLLPAGLILDRFSTRTVILSSMTLCIGGTLGFAVSHTVWLAGLFHFMSGVGNAFCFLSCMMLTARWFPANRRAFVVGVIVTMAMVGGVVAQTPLAWLSSSYGWRHALFIDAALGLAIMSVIWFFVRDYPEDYQEERTQNEAAPSFFISLRGAFLNSQNWLCGFYASLMNLPIMLLGAVWGDLFLNQVHGISMTRATVATSALFIGTIIGSPLVGYYSDKMKSRKKPMLFGAITSILTIFYILYTPGMGFMTATLAFLALGFFTSSQVIAYPTITESSPSNITGTSMGLASVLIMGGAAIAQPLFGYLIEIGWNHEVIHSVPHFSQANFHHGMILFPVAFVIALLALSSLRETGCRPLEEHAN